MHVFIVRKPGYRYSLEKDDELETKSLTKNSDAKMIVEQMKKRIKKYNKENKTPTRVYIYITFSDGEEREKEIRSAPHLKKIVEDTGIVGEMLK